MTTVLVINSGSSSVKFSVLSLPEETVVVSGIRERIGGVEGDFSHHSDALRDILSSLPSSVDVELIGHRVVHGGTTFRAPVLVDDNVVEVIRNLSPLAPLHNPANVEGIVATKAMLPAIPQVAVFDTAFFHSLEAPAFRYAIPRELADPHGLRKYGFHGTSHQYVSEELIRLSGASPRRVITVHLGNGSSVTAIRDGVALDTSMGLTPMQGLVMGTRSGDIDPGLVLYLQRELGLTLSDVDHLLNRRSGLLGLTGSSDMRDVWSRAHTGDPQANEAIDIWAWRVRHYLGAYFAQLGGLDALVFTGGIGENQAQLRAAVLSTGEALGITLDSAANEATHSHPRRISHPSSSADVWVIPTNEELQIARLASGLVTA